MTFSASAATSAPSAGTTVVITIPAFPASSVAHALKKAFKEMPNFKITATSKNSSSGASNGALDFTDSEIGESKNVAQATIAALYKINLPNHRQAQLIVLKFAQNSPGAVVQVDTPAFTLHQGEHVIMVWHGTQRRVLPYDGPKLAPGQ
jgi:hypothetical protein